MLPLTSHHQRRSIVRFVCGAQPVLAWLQCKPIANNVSLYWLLFVCSPALPEATAKHCCYCGWAHRESLQNQARAGCWAVVDAGAVSQVWSRERHSEHEDSCFYYRKLACEYLLLQYSVRGSEIPTTFLIVTTPPSYSVTALQQRQRDSYRFLCTNSLPPLHLWGQESTLAGGGTISTAALPPCSDWMCPLLGRLCCYCLIKTLQSVQIVQTVSSLHFLFMTTELMHC